ncbi:SCP2 sterol-binding domain-containing protein [Frankia sp. AgKG'84/4]|uniref:SCP2 sterol-binding domain-containing protein n=1 Tax=Frankia sp. AgKG'84/4 TaxID=573490 RepID=UPI00200BC602|nr:alkyl sulfatase C-terminal domain-containing protein [Frankia sp. AgKG'84/4]MCL9795085.1 SCP2 sterol-binding domain-containing protein [Frankia sp. AgKG'84/4]
MSTTATVRFLSEEYLARLARLPAEHQPGIEHVNVRLQWRATSTPTGEVPYHLVVERGTLVRAGAGALAGADLTITATYQDLADFEAGTLHAATAFVTGQFAVTGDKAKLLELMVVLQTGCYHRFTAGLWASATR